MTMHQLGVELRQRVLVVHAVKPPSEAEDAQRSEATGE
jgi:hypothetical protein